MSNQDSYNTIKDPAEGLYKEKSSKFYAYISNVTSVEAFESFLLGIKKQHPKARHWCYAYQIQQEEKEHLFRINDDGEPSGTAGKPIYGQILSAGLVDVCIVVVRYFGGTKLGASGLIQAYKTAAELAIENAQIVTKWNTTILKLVFDYEIMGPLLKILKDLNLNIVSTDYAASPQLSIEVNRSEENLKIKLIKAKFLNRKVQDIKDDDEIKGLKFVRTD